MEEELGYEYADFLECMRCGNFVFGRFFSQDDYEDEYAHNQISKYQGKFMDQVKKYLRKNFPGKYVVYSDWCVFVMTVEEAKKRNIKKYPLYIVK